LPQLAGARYRWLAGGSPEAAVREIAAAMAGEEAQHIRWVQHALEYHPAAGVPWQHMVA